jgi:hypothetical protein
MDNKRGSLGLSIIFVLFFWVIGFGCVNFIMDEVYNTTVQLNCDSTTISAGTMFLCLALDTTVIYFIMTILSIMLGAITSKLLL